MLLPGSAGFSERLKLGADAHLVRLFGPDQAKYAKESANELRDLVFSRGLVTVEGIRDLSNPTLLHVPDHGEDVYPAFQFEVGATDPHPRIAVINFALNAIQGARSWETAMWWFNINGRLDGITPLEAHESEVSGKDLLAAAYYEIYD